MKKRNSFYKVLSLLVTLAMVCGMAITTAAATDDEYLPDGDETEITETAEKIANESTTDPVEDAVEPTAESTEEEVAETTAEPAEEVPADNETEPVEEVAEEIEDETELTADTWDGSTATGFAGGSGTEDDPYVIETGAQLAYLAQQVNDGTSYSGIYFQLDNSIDLSNYTWTGIGTAVLTSASSNSPYPTTESKGFAGTFCGGGNTITVARTVGSGTGMAAVGGVFNYLAPGGVVQNLNVAGTLTVESAGYSYADAVGGVVGYNDGEIDNVSSSVTITAATAATTTANGSGCYNVGGIAGFNDHYYMAGAIGVIRNCRNTGSVTAYEKVGGITGENAGLIASCSNSGQISPTSTRRSGAGGIVGRNGDNDTALETGKIWCCLNTGDIYSGEPGTTTEAQKTQSSWLGGIAGYQNAKSSTSNCYNSGNLRGYGYAGYTLGASDNAETNDGVTSCYYATGLTGATTGDQAGVDGEAASSATNLIDSLNTGTDATAISGITGSYGTWKTDTTTPELLWNANATYIDGAKGWENQAKTVYLDGTATTNGDGSESSPYNNMDDAVEAANGGTVLIKGTVTLNESKSYYYSVTFKRDASCEGPMFIIDAPDNEYGIAYVTMTSAVIDGNGSGTIFEVVQGRLRMRGSLTLQNADTGVVVDAKTDDNALVQAQVEVNYTTIDAAQAIVLEGVTSVVGSGDKAQATNTAILNFFGSDAVSLNGVVSLASDAYLTVYSALTCDVSVECAAPDSNVKVATGNVVGGDNYTLQGTDLAKIHYYGNGYTLKFGTDNDVVLGVSKTVYLNGTAATNGTGTAANPYNNLQSALDDSNANLILVTGTVNLGAGTYNKDVAIQRAAGFDGTMFTVNLFDQAVDNENIGPVTIQQMTISGRAAGTSTTKGTGIAIYADRLTLDGGATVSGCEVGVDATFGGTLTFKQAAIKASQYSVKVANLTDNFILNCVSVTSLFGDVYLGNGAYISITAPMTCEVTVKCANDTAGTVIAKGIGYSLTQTDADFFYDASDNYGVMEVPAYMGTAGATTELQLVNRVYVDGSAADGGDGTKASPYNNLRTALNQAGVTKKVVITGTVALSGEYSYSRVATVQRGDDLTGPMFTVSDGANVTLTSFTITGRGHGDIIQISGGTLNLKGGMELSNCGIAIDIVGGDVTISQAEISANEYSVYLGAGSGTFTMDAISGTKINGAVYLATGKRITVARTLANVSTGITVTCEDYSEGRWIAESQTTGYTMRYADVGSIVPTDRAYSTVYAASYALTIGMNNYRFLDGTATTNGDGSETSPYNNLASALADTRANKTIVVTGTVALDGTTYEATGTASAVIERDASLTVPMFTVNNSGTELKNLVIAGEGADTLISVTGGELTLDGGTVLEGCETAVNVTGGNITVKQAEIDADLYSVYMGANSGTFTLIPTEDTELSGTVYLANNKWITVDGDNLVADMTGKIVIQCANPSTDPATIVAQASDDYVYFDEADVNKFEYLNNAYTINIRSDEDDNQLVLFPANSNG
jgi:hypothetical protein